MTATITWFGKTGQAYTFEAHPIGTEFRPVSGVYIICRQAGREWWDAPGDYRWAALYVGEAGSLSGRLNAGSQAHDGLRRSVEQGATHVCALLVSGEAERLRIETDLRHSLNPPCNMQAVPNEIANALLRISKERVLPKDSLVNALMRWEGTADPRAGEAYSNALAKFGK